MYRCTVSSPLGLLTLASDGESLTGLWLPEQKYFAAGLEADAEEFPDLPIFRQTREWLSAYFAGTALPPMPPLRPRGTAFRQQVWDLLTDIPYGETVTYGDLAARLREQGQSGSPRAVGGAVGHNPISILIPCHRVIGAGGRLTGYAGGLSAKETLLNLEKQHREHLAAGER